MSSSIDTASLTAGLRAMRMGCVAKQTNQYQTVCPPWTRRDIGDMLAIRKNLDWLLNEVKSGFMLTEQMHGQMIRNIDILHRELCLKEREYQCRSNPWRKPAGSANGTGGEFDFSPDNGGAGHRGGDATATQAPLKPSSQEKPNAGNNHLSDGLRRSNKIPPNAQYYLSRSGGAFHAPANVDWQAIVDAGKANRSLDVEATMRAVGHGGKFDFQRIDASQGVLYGEYVDASNYAVGLYMYGAGFSERQMIAVGGTYSFLFSSNPSSDQVPFWQMGWRDAAAKKYPLKVPGPKKGKLEK